MSNDIWHEVCAAIRDELRQEYYDSVIVEQQPEIIQHSNTVTPKQLVFLAELGFTGKTDKLTKASASRLISKLIGQRDSDRETKKIQDYYGYRR